MTIVDNYGNDIIKEMPVGNLCFMPLGGTEGITEKIDGYIKEWSKKKVELSNNKIMPSEYIKDSFIIKPTISWFGTGEAKGSIQTAVRGYDIFIIVEVTNFSQTYKLFGNINRMWPGHFQDLKRVIAATNGKAKRVNVIMPFLYESRQHNRIKRESLDCALMLEELVSIGVDTIITVNAHYPKIVNAISLASFDSINCYYQFVQTLLNSFDDIKVDRDNIMMISPDSGALQRTIYFVNVLGIDLGMFYKRRNYRKVVDGRNPIVAHEFLGNSVEGKDVIIIDDMISSGESLIDTAKELKKRNAKRVFACWTFGLFTHGLDMFDKADKDGIIEAILTTNCIYQTEELKNKSWYKNVDVTAYLAKIIDCINHDSSIGAYFEPVEKIHNFVKRYIEQK